MRSARKDSEGVYTRPARRKVRPAATEGENNGEKLNGCELLKQ